MIPNYNTEQLKEILKDFFILTNIRIVIFDDKLNQILSYPEIDTKFCRTIRKDPKVDAECKQSDYEACMECKRRNELYTYHCHIGLTETVAPLKYNEITIGYIMFGQILQSEKKEEKWKEILENCRDYNIDFEKLKEAFFEKNPFPEKNYMLPLKSWKHVPVIFIFP